MKFIHIHRVGFSFVLDTNFDSLSILTEFLQWMKKEKEGSRQENCFLQNGSFNKFVLVLSLLSNPQLLTTLFFVIQNLIDDNSNFLLNR